MLREDVSSASIAFTVVPFVLLDIVQGRWDKPLVDELKNGRLS